MAKHKGLPIRAFSSFAACAKWFAGNHDRNEDGVWLKFAKKRSGLKSITYVEAREVAIIYGWIDGLKNAIDERHYAIRFTPRRRRSKWSKINREIAETLIKQKRLEPAGLAQVNAAKKDGRWEKAYDGPATMQVPADFRAALAGNTKAKRAFAKVSAANRYAILFAIHDAKREDTRVRRIEKFVAMLAAGDVPHPNR